MIRFFIKIQKRFKKRRSMKELPGFKKREYLFDTQKLRFKIGAKIDTCISRLNQSRFFESTFINVKGLKEGYQIDAIEFEEQFNEQTN